MPDARNYVQGRYIDYYTSNKFEFTPLFDPTEDIEWGYTTKDGVAYRHLNSTEVSASISDMRENNGFGVYHSLTEYEDPSESNYNNKRPVRTRLAVRVQTNSSTPTIEEWDDLVSTANEAKSVLQREFPFEFTALRTSINTIVLLSNDISFTTPSNLQSRMESYITPDRNGSFDISSINPTEPSSSRSEPSPPSKLSKNVKKYVRGKYQDMRETAIEALNGADISGYSSTDDEDFPEEEIDEEFFDLLDNLQEIDGIASTKSFQFVQSLVSKQESDITGTYMVETTFNCKKVSQHYAEEYLSQGWFGDSSKTNLSVVDVYGLIPCEGSLSTQGGFYVYEEDLDDMDYIPSDHLAEFYSENSIKISMDEESVQTLQETELDIELGTDVQKVPEDIGILLLSSGFAKKESEL